MPVTIETLPPYHRIYHVRPLLATRVMFFAKCADPSPHALAALTSFGQRILPMLMSIPGVDNVSFERYSVTLKRAHAFTWDELEPQILEVFQRLLDGE